MGFSLSDLGYLGSGMIKEQQVNRKRKDTQRQGLMHYLALGNAEKGRESAAANLLGYRKLAAKQTQDLAAARLKSTQDSAAGRLQQSAAKAAADNRLHAAEGFPRAVGGIAPANQPGFVSRYNAETGTHFAVPGEMTGETENRNYGLPEALAGPVRKTLAQVMETVAPGSSLGATLKPVTAPYYGLNAKDAATTGEKVRSDQAREGEVGTNHRMTLKEVIRNHTLQHGDRQHGQGLSHLDRVRSQDIGSTDRRRAQDIGSTDRVRSQDIGHQDRMRSQDMSFETREQGLTKGKAGMLPSGMSIKDDHLLAGEAAANEAKAGGLNSYLLSGNDANGKPLAGGDKQMLRHRITDLQGRNAEIGRVRSRHASPSTLPVAPGMTPGYSLRSFPRGANPAPPASLGPLPGATGRTLREFPRSGQAAPHSAGHTSTHLAHAASLETEISRLRTPGQNGKPLIETSPAHARFHAHLVKQHQEIISQSQAQPGHQVEPGQVSSMSNAQFKRYFGQRLLGKMGGR
jgi:hypothetical protein